MQDFNVNINIRNCLICSGCRQIYEKEVTVTSSSQTIILLNNYILNVVAVTDSGCTIIIQNGRRVILRNIYDFDTQICVPTDNCRYFITISCSHLT